MDDAYRFVSLEYTGRFPSNFSMVTLTLSLMHATSCHYITVWWSNDIGSCEMARAFSISYGTDAYRDSAIPMRILWIIVQMHLCIMESTYVCWDQRCCEVDGASRAGHTSCFRLSRDLTCPGPIVCLLSDGGPGFVSDVFGLATYI
jgi:hypothetical protein